MGFAPIYWQGVLKVRNANGTHRGLREELFSVRNANGLRVIYILRMRTTGYSRALMQLIMSSSLCACLRTGACTWPSQCGLCLLPLHLKAQG